MRRGPRSRGPSSADLVRQTRVRKLLCQYGAYSREVVSRKSSTTMESSSYLSARRASSKASASALQYCMSDAATAGRCGKVIHEDADLKLSARSGAGIVRDLGQMDKGLALAASQYVALALSNGDLNTVEAQRLKEQFLHQLERDWGFAGAENLSLGRIRITIKRRDDLEAIRKRAELEKMELERKRLEEERSRAVRVQSSRVQSSAVSSQVKSSQVSSSTTKVVQTRVVKTVKRTVQTVRAA